MSEPMKRGLKQQKQEVVRDALYVAAVDLFVANGFEETTVEEVAQAAGVSRRTFFRYFESKDDLLSYPMASYALVLTEAVRKCPSDCSPFTVLREAVAAGVDFIIAAESRTRQVISLSTRSSSARQAYQSRMLELDDSLAHAYARHFHDRISDARPRLLAGLTITIMNVSILTWFHRQSANLGTIARESLDELSSWMKETPNPTPPSGGVATSSKRHKTVRT